MRVERRSHVEDPTIEQLAEVASQTDDLAVRRQLFGIRELISTVIPLVLIAPLLRSIRTRSLLLVPTLLVAAYWPFRAAGRHLFAGLRAYSIVMRPYVSTDRIPELYPHNVFLAMWSELGILGLVAFMLLLGTLLWRGWRAYGAADGFARPLLWGTSAAFIAISVHGLFDTPYFKNDLAIEFWVVAALEIAAIGAFMQQTTRKRELQR